MKRVFFAKVCSTMSYVSDDQLFIITINGRNFSEILTPEYRSQSSSYNLSYSVPISKYMPDEFINLTFR